MQIKSTEATTLNGSAVFFSQKQTVLKINIFTVRNTSAKQSVRSSWPALIVRRLGNHCHPAAGWHRALLPQDRLHDAVCFGTTVRLRPKSHTFHTVHFPVVHVPCGAPRARHSNGVAPCGTTPTAPTEILNTTSSSWNISQCE